ncbi:nicotinamide riboside transporter PnuC [Fictibacillus iocasae]|uniref:Nicotinamide riboside transporter PnuC n=1 Tax=Fictibacillus iocasae TaxID=2715437 RepID=A0ABW2NP02_9BACL
MNVLSNIELWAAVTGLACVFLAARENIWSYPVGIINVVLFMVMFYQVQLFPDVTLQVIFLVLTVYGWYVWLTGSKNVKAVRKTRSMTTREIVVSALVLVLLTPAAGWLYHEYSAAVFGSDAVLPFVDSFILVASILAQWFLSKKVIQTWFLWIAVDLVAVPLYFSRGLTITAVLYIFFLANAVYGYLAWRHVMKKEKAEQTEAA